MFRGMRLDAEANTQAEFYHCCRLLGLQCVLEVTTPAGRIDVAILTQDRLSVVAFVEVKRREASFGGGNSSQLRRYKQLGVPIYGLSEPARAMGLAATLSKLPESSAKTIAEIMAKTHIKEARKEFRKRSREMRLSENLNLKP